MHIKMYLIESPQVYEVPVVTPTATASGSSNEGILDAPGYYLYLPPNLIKPRFFMLEEKEKKFYDVDLFPDRLGNPPEWKAGISSQMLGRNLAIVIPVRLDEQRKAELKRQGYNPEFEVGRVVQIDRTEGRTKHGRVLGKVNMNPSKYMDWATLRDRKGDILPDEIANGLLGSLWGNLYPDRKEVHPEILAKMSRPWNVNPEVLSKELDNMFASGKAIETGEIRWILNV